MQHQDRGCTSESDGAGRGGAVANDPERLKPSSCARESMHEDGSLGDLCWADYKSSGIAGTNMESARESFTRGERELFVATAATCRSGRHRGFKMKK